MKNDTEEWERDFREFLEAPMEQPPESATRNIVSVVKKELNPESWMVFVKLVAATSISAAFSLAICPQFGFGGASWLMNFFMQFGHRVCSIACGSIFLAIGIGVAFFILRPEELRVLQKTRFLQISLLSLASLSAFVCAEAEFYLGIAAFWILGAVLGGLIAFRIGYRIRFADLRAKEI